jgi:hypothetical protein
MPTASSHLSDQPRCPPFLILQHFKVSKIYEKINQMILSKSIIKKELIIKLAALWGNQTIQERLLHNNINMMNRCLWKLNSIASLKSNITRILKQLPPIIMKINPIEVLKVRFLGFKADILHISKKIFKILSIAHSPLIP